MASLWICLFNLVHLYLSYNKKECIYIYTLKSKCKYLVATQYLPIANQISRYSLSPRATVTMLIPFDIA
jgi:hypothetical protein